VFQTTTLSATASWGGSGLTSIDGADVTSLVTIQSVDAQVVAIVGGTVAAGRRVGGPVSLSILQFGSVAAANQVRLEQPVL
jgi:hypothetical protein